MFVRIPDPGMPEGIIVHGGVVYVSTHTSVRGNANQGPSKIFSYNLDTRAKVGEWTIQGQKLDATHGVLAMVFDAQGRLYVIDRNPGRLLRINLSTGAQETFATFPDLPSCPLGASAPPPPPCSPTLVDQATFTDFIVFDGAGNTYVSDFESATIWRVPPGGGSSEIWFQDSRLDGVFGPNGMALDQAGGKLYVAMTASVQPTSPGQGIIYTLPVVGRPTAADLKAFFTYLEPARGPDGIAFGASGKLYVALAGSNQISILNPNGTEANRFPDPAANQMQEIPYDLPASIAFDGKGSILVTNQSFFAADSNHWAVLRAYVNDTARPLREP